VTFGQTGTNGLSSPSPSYIRKERNANSAGIPKTGSLESRLEQLSNACGGVDVNELLVDLLRAPLRVRNSLKAMLVAKLSRKINEGIQTDEQRRPEALSSENKRQQRQHKQRSLQQQQQKQERQQQKQSPQRNGNKPNNSKSSLTHRPRPQDPPNQQVITPIKTTVTNVQTGQILSTDDVVAPTNNPKQFIEDQFSNFPKFNKKLGGNGQRQVPGQRQPQTSAGFQPAKLSPTHTQSNPNRASQQQQKLRTSTFTAQQKEPVQQQHGSVLQQKQQPQQQVKFSQPLNPRIVLPSAIKSNQNRNNNN